jgi:phosphinothricin acetyltransferase
MIVAPARPDDLAAVARIYSHYVTDSVATFEEIPPTAADWADKLGTLRELKLPFLVARDGGTVLGYAYAAPWRPKPAYRYSVEDSIYLAPQGMGRGLGRILLSGVLDGCAAAGMRNVIAVITDAGGQASVALHRSLGFTEAGRLTAVGYKHGRWIDTILMQRDLGVSHQGQD